MRVRERGGGGGVLLEIIPTVGDMSVGFFSNPSPGKRDVFGDLNNAHLGWSGKFRSRILARIP